MFHRSHVQRGLEILDRNNGEVWAKLDAGTYGACESCGQQIAEARLEAKPAARLCITCASKTR